MSFLVAPCQRREHLVIVFWLLFCLFVCGPSLNPSPKTKQKCSELETRSGNRNLQPPKHLLSFFFVIAKKWSQRFCQVALFRLGTRIFRLTQLQSVRSSWVFASAVINSDIWNKANWGFLVSSCLDTHFSRLQSEERHSLLKCVEVTGVKDLFHSSKTLGKNRNILLFIDKDKYVLFSRLSYFIRGNSFCTALCALPV